MGADRRGELVAAGLADDLPGGSSALALLAQRSVTMEDLVVLGMERGEALDTEADD